MFKISATLDETYTMIQAHRVLRAIEIWTAVWNTPEFKDRVLSSSFTQTDVKTGEAVYEAITALGENAHAMYALDPEDNGSETARTDTVTGITTIDVRWLSPETADLYDLVNTLSHEFTHTPQGGSFTHSAYYSRFVPYLSGRPFSVPYLVGDITEEIARTMFPGELPA